MDYGLPKPKSFNHIQSDLLTIVLQNKRQIKLNSFIKIFPCHFLTSNLKSNCTCCYNFKRNPNVKMSYVSTWLKA